MIDSSLSKSFQSSDNPDGLLKVSVLRRRRDFLHVQKKGIRQVMPHFILQAVMSGSSSVRSEISIRMGVTASKKVGNAVARNRAKRRMRALFSKLKSLNTYSSTDYVLVARESLGKADWTELSADFFKAAKRIHKKLNENRI